MKLRCLLLLGACVSASACAEEPQFPPVTDHSIYQQGAARPAHAPSNDVMNDILGRLDQLQSEVQQLRGQVEEQDHRIEELKRRQENIYSDLDGRLQKLEPGNAGNTSVPTAEPQTSVEQQASEPQPVAETPAHEEPRGSEATPPASASEPAPAAPVDGTGVKVEQQPQASEAVAEQEQNTAAQNTDVPMPGDEKQLYQAAYSALKNRQNDQAIQLLKKLTEDYPDGKYADSAYYWLGETYKLKKDNDAARTSYDYLISHYPSSPKVADAMLKLGFLEYDQQNRDRARELFKAIIAKYPGSSPATLAANKLRLMDKR